jgi:hypothetical protein
VLRVFATEPPVVHEDVPEIASPTAPLETAGAAPNASPP